MSDKRRDIFDAIKAQLLAEITWAKSVEWENIRILSSDFGEHEIPRIQFYTVGTSFKPIQGQVQATTSIVIEVCLKSSTLGVVDQRDLFDKMNDVMLAMGKKANLWLPGVIHIRPLSDECDTHTIQPHFIGIMVFEVVYLTTYTGC
jgi:hypothetical protein